MRDRFSAEVLLLVGVLIWSFNFTAMKYSLGHGFNPLAFAALRWTIAGVAYAGITWQRERSFRVTRRDFLLMAGVAVVGVTVNQISNVYALHLAPASTVAIVFGSFPIIVLIIARVAGVERLQLRQVLAAGVSFGGVALVGLGAKGGLGGHLGGVLLTLATAATFAVYSVAAMPIVKRYSLFRMNTVIAVVGAVGLLAVASTHLGDVRWGEIGALSWGGLLYAGICTSVLGNILWFTAVGRVGASHSSLYSNLQPFLGAIFAVLILSESLGTLQIVGGLVVLGGILLVRRARPTVVPPVE